MQATRFIESSLPSDNVVLALVLRHPAADPLI
jgi:hypothetical protein